MSSLAEAAQAQALAAAIDAVGSDAHVDRLVDVIGGLVPHDLVTVVRYSLSERPEFVTHRNYSDAMIAAYLDRYYPHDPFYRQWREEQRPGVVRLQAAAPVQYVSEFLVQSVITDELGVLLADGPGWCLGIFLDRRKGRFSPAEMSRLEAQYPVLAALHGLDTRSRQPNFRRTAQPPVTGQHPAQSPGAAAQDRVWPSLSARERDIVGLILAGHPTAGIAAKLGLARGTVKNHRRSIYTKLDITSERELFLQYLDATRRRS
ncbi:helix-turn-helix transcriptional regulator [Aestuariivirga litoralis]|uniref:Helix-turn-helix transcriptional regulator n=1 Tax=Aestuariivirga litoralis TaxID=2650924 RepID=A0A2W2BVP6_9HYPH|nr:helix-turn-helix transcriptional regulator [Aestuariivirga litoralis]PZF77556.1 helix-turn-helix transcriptional regulator [Aestuariivirga litoralis]